MYIQDLEHTGETSKGEGHLVDTRQEAGHDKVEEIYFGDETLNVDHKNVGYCIGLDDDNGVFFYQDNNDINKFYLIYLEWNHSYYIECRVHELKDALFLLQKNKRGCNHV